MPADTKPRQPSKYWMRSVSFVGLHRLLHVVAEHPEGLRPQEVNEIILDKNIPLMRGRLNPSPTTLYHYRNTLIRLGALTKDGSTMQANYSNVDVCGLLELSLPSDDAEHLTGPAQEHFGDLVLQNEQCRLLFFDLFMPPEAKNYSVIDFRKFSFPVEWKRLGSRKAILRNIQTCRALPCTTPTSINAILYGLRYWARNELGLVDEYSPRKGKGVIMFPLSCRTSDCSSGGDLILSTARFLLSQRKSDDWTLFSIDGLIESICLGQGISIGVLFRSIDWLYENYREYIMLIPTSRGLATITAGSHAREEMELRQYYRRERGPYISHLRIHRKIDINMEEQEVRHVG